MDDDIFSNLSVVNAKKTYKAKKGALRYNTETEMRDTIKPQPLTTKVAVKYLLEGRLKSKVCRYCLNITTGLSELDQIMKIGGTGSMYKVTIRDIVASFHPFKVVEDANFPDKICQKCLDRALSAYLFTQQCERAERAMLNCFDDMYEKFEKLDPIDRPKKRGRQKLNPNYNILHAEHNKVIDYAEPIINIVNVGAETFTKEPELNDLECKKCWQVLPNMESLLNHEKIHPKTMWYHCRLCGKSFPKRNQLKKHNNREHVLGKEVRPQVDKDFKCKECDHVTENFIQHLQHMEKHKFRSLMEHLIEKKMDSLCVICFNKGSNLNDLDKMVCLHGGHPDLMGDKTLYHILASTLPKPNSYKYQELYVPSTAQIMTISKRPYSNDDRSVKTIKSELSNNDYKESFTFSNPIVITRKRFKTDHFYYYVLCDPDYHFDDSICDIFIEEDNVNLPGVPNITKIVEVIEIDEIDDESYPKRAKIDPKISNICAASSSINETNKEYAAWATKAAGTKKTNNTFDAIKQAMLIADIYDEIEEEPDQKATEHCDKRLNPNVTKENESNKPVIEEVDNSYILPSLKMLQNDNKRKDDTERTVSTSKQSTYEFSNPEYNIKALEAKTNIVSQGESIVLKEEKTAMKCDAKRLKKDNCDKCWLFKNTCEVCKSHNNVAISTTDVEKKGSTECKFCWVFKESGKCDYCKKPIKDDEPVKVKVTNEFNNNVENFKVVEDEIWQCSVCLTNNNPNRITCHCCGTVKDSDYTDIKITFGNNVMFFQAKEKDNYELIQSEYTKNDDNTANASNNELNEVAHTEETALMDYRSNCEDLEASNTNTMDIETNATLDIIEVEDMDVEENPVIVNRGLDWTESRLFNVDNSRPSVEATVQFNIGCMADQKPQQRKFKKAKRNLPKTLNK